MTALFPAWQGKRDGLYYRQYVYDATRVKKLRNAAHIFKCAPARSPWRVLGESGPDATNLGRIRSKVPAAPLAASGMSARCC
jgi:hypothetical protein